MAFLFLFKGTVRAVSLPPRAEADELFVCFWHVSDCYLPRSVKISPGYDARGA